jgi:hypothetical protein
MAATSMDINKPGDKQRNGRQLGTQLTKLRCCLLDLLSATSE